VGTTIPHEVEMPYGAALVRLKPASTGTGVVAGGAIRPVLELAGIRDVLAKSLGSRNPINTARATMECLKALKVPDRVAEMRERPLRELVPWLVRKREQEGLLETGPEGLVGTDLELATESSDAEQFDNEQNVAE